MTSLLKGFATRMRGVVARHSGGGSDLAGVAVSRAKETGPAVESCSPGLLVSRARARRQPAGFRPGFWPQGQLEAVYSSYATQESFSGESIAPESTGNSRSASRARGGWRVPRDGRTVPSASRTSIQEVTCVWLPWFDAAREETLATHFSPLAGACGRGR